MHPGLACWRCEGPAAGEVRGDRREGRVTAPWGVLGAPTARARPAHEVGGGHALQHAQQGRQQRALQRPAAQLLQGRVSTIPAFYLYE